MGIDPSCNVKIYDMICGSKADEVEKRTTIFKEKRLEMHAYLRDAETRGSSRMVTEPTKHVLYDSFNYLPESKVQ
jgi:hypothetical protein